MWRITALCIVITGLAANDYEGYKVFSIVPTTQSQLELLQELRNKFSYWREPSWINREVLIMVSPHKLLKFYKNMNKINMAYDLKINNVQKLIDATMPQNQSKGFDFKSYHTLEEIYANLDELAKQYPDKVQVVVGGRTYEGRDIKGVKIISNREKPGIFIEGGIHANEWISPATVMYILHQLLSSKDPNVRYIADLHNWFIFPIFNPDGYAYTFIPQNRLWRKTRKPSSSICVGSDPNRNWDIQWNTTGVSPNPCAEDYPGSEPFSEVEMKSMSQYIRSNIHNFYAYISFHSFAQQLLFPYAFTKAHIIFDYDASYRIGSRAIEALKHRYNTRYQTGCLGEFQGELNGLSTDYVAGIFRKRIVYTYELRDTGRYGFLLPPNQIIPTGEETLDSLIALFTEALSHKYAKNNYIC